MDQLLVAHVGQVYTQRGHDVVWARAMIEVVIDVLKYDYDVLMPALEALKDALPGFEVSGGSMDGLL
jgi:hypothetical protein